MFELTEGYINSKRTKNGGFTKRQIDALGLTWPVAHKQVLALAGTTITFDQKKRFEDGRRVLAIKSKSNSTHKYNAKKTAQIELMKEMMAAGRVVKTKTGWKWKR